jgi:outer membrane protein TolC
MKSNRKNIGIFFCCIMFLTGCTSVSVNDLVQPTNQELQQLEGHTVSLNQTEQDRQTKKALVNRILEKPLSLTDTVQLSLLNSADVQVLLANTWAETALAAQDGRLVNPTFSFERARISEEIDLTRAISFNLLNLLTLPKRREIAKATQHYNQTQLVSELLGYITEVKQAWVMSVVANQKASYAQQVYEVAQVSAELAKRMKEAGNFNQLQQSTQQQFELDAKTELDIAKQNQVIRRETLVRLLGLTLEQSRQLQLPLFLPDLPKEPKSVDLVNQAINEQRLDIRLAKARLDWAFKQQGLKGLVVDDLELGLSKTTNSSGNTTNSSQISIELPIFDWKQDRRNAYNARSMAAATELEAVFKKVGSQLKQSYADYLSQYEIAKRYQLEVLPLSKQIAQENALRYNGMLVDIFMVLDDAKRQINQVVAATEAEQAFWLADIALQATVLGQSLLGIVEQGSVSRSSQTTSNTSAQ